MSLLSAKQVREMRKNAQRELVQAAESVILARKCLDDESLSLRAQLGRARLILRDGEKHVKIALNLHNNIRTAIETYEARKRQLG